MKHQGIDILAIVGRPNVGKSTLFNRIIGRRVAIVHEESGVTRDRISAIATWEKKSFEVVDTGGIAFFDAEKTPDIIASATTKQAEIAIEMATAIVMVVDVTAGITPLDLEIAQRLRKSGKLIVLAINKADNQRREKDAIEFEELGFQQCVPISAAHGNGVSTLLDQVTQDFATSDFHSQEPTRIAVVGRPNVGKSSLLNRLLKDERTIVSPIAGTTRDSVDIPFEIDGKPYILVDTAGIKHRRKTKTSVDQFGLMRAERSIRQCDIAVLVLDATARVTKQDKKIAGLINEATCACVILVNKWDLVTEQELAHKKKTLQRPGKRKSFENQYVEGLRQELFFLDWAPAVFTSAKTGDRVHELFKSIGLIEQEMQLRVETPELNRLLARCIDSYPPPLIRGHRFKVLYGFQKSSAPPTFAMFVNDPNSLTPHYERFLVDRIRQQWGFLGCPILLELKQRTRRQSFQNQAFRGRSKKI